MRRDKRRDVRRHAGLPATIVVSQELPELTCMVLDISERGARLQVRGANALPDNFTLSLARMGRVERSCRLVWRNGNEVGVRFPAREARTAGASIISLQIKCSDTAPAPAEKPAEILEV